ncbi:MAG: alpha/beta hydrolase [Chloroflexi bacterium]|nr:MAG: alpha/beta hydrolase [Chloroflexota bacterium]
MLQETTDYTKFEDKKVYYEMAGEGSPLVFMHAGIVDSQMWDNQWFEFRKHYTVIRYDLLGFGKSDPLEEPVSRRQELYRVLEATGIKRAILVGCSLSGETILDVALDHPELVSGLVVVSAVPGGFEMQGEPPQDLLDMMAALEQGDRDLATEHQMRLSIDGPYRQPEQVDILVRERAAEMNRKALAKDTKGLNLAPPPDPLDPSAAQQLDQIKAPTLIISGELDNPEILRAADVMAGTIPGAQKAIIPGSAHLPNMERPAEFNRVVLDFL